MSATGSFARHGIAGFASPIKKAQSRCKEMRVECRGMAGGDLMIRAQTVLQEQSVASRDAGGIMLPSFGCILVSAEKICTVSESDS